MNTVSQSLWRFNHFPIVFTSCKQPLDAFSDLYVRCVHYAKYLEHMNNFCDNMELQMV